MNRSLRLDVLATLIFGLQTVTLTAAESFVYTFPEGTITITPRPSQRALESAANRQISDTAVQTAASIEINPGQRRLRVQPVSLQQPPTLTPPAPTPLLNETVPPVSQPQQVPPPSPTPTSLPPAPIPSQVEQTPGCCDEPIITPRHADPLPKSTVTVPLAAMYKDVYNSIPFSRVEFNHYPNYRHDATMEFLFNQMRNTVIYRNTSSVAHDYGYNYGPGYGYLGYPYYDPPAYPFSYGLRIHRSR